MRENTLSTFEGLSHHHKALRKKHTMANVESITHGYLTNHYDLTNREGSVYDFISMREMRGLTAHDAQGNHWSTFGEGDQLILAISILDGEATGMLSQFGGIQ